MHQDDYWTPLADLMTGLMLIFLLLAVLYMLKVKTQLHKLNQVKQNQEYAKTYLYQELKHKLGVKLNSWQAKVDKGSLGVTFDNLNTLFNTGSANISPKYQLVLTQFFPLYLKTILHSPYHNIIKQIVIEGYTSSVWNNNTTENEAYLKNMQLSENRAFSVLAFVYQLPTIKPYQNYLKTHLIANGFSSNALILNHGRENPKASQRVVIRLELY